MLLVVWELLDLIVGREEQVCWYCVLQDCEIDPSTNTWLMPVLVALDIQWLVWPVWTRWV